MNQRKLKLHHYDLRSLAKSLKLASIDVIKTSQMDVESHWFHAKGPADLYFWKSKDKIIKHQISLFNQVVEWNEFDGVKTGYVNDDIDAGKSEVICFDENINPTVIEQAIEFLHDVDGLEDEVLRQLISNYKFYNRWEGLGISKIFSSLIKKVLKK